MDNRSNQLMGGLSTVGFFGGIYVAYKRDPRFWTYAGLAIGGSILGVALGKIVSALVFPPVNNNI